MDEQKERSLSPGCNCPHKQQGLEAISSLILLRTKISIFLVGCHNTLVCSSPIEKQVEKIRTHLSVVKLCINREPFNY